MAASEGPALISKAPSSELKTRVLSAIVMIALALGAAYWGGWPFAMFWLAAGIAIMIEWTDMTGIEPRRIVQTVFGLGLLTLTLLYLMNAGFAAGAGAALLFLVLGALVARGSREKLWAASAFAYAAVIVLVPPMVRDYPEIGLLGLIWMFAVVWTTDIAAYFTGRTLGGPKLCPAVSPKKTWSGFLGGLFAAALAGFLVAWIGRRWGIDHAFGPVSVIALSMVASVASQIGDLGESALKRHCDVKDSSHLIPGHGGVMDRLDGFWAVALLIGIALLAAHGTA
ncbi:phosphatidate cytidylyltransferase [Microvirga guangxiensis]|uniref:Phosphatidate cytidylyltransferase n=1 Tax=Microvirga guangxiensis TaxID=549386 RepID=A0A1G5J6F9_9HYPH|nr:phosphatidate cytidylyltransferase [Microvirga guangxiensis]SCY83520.1 phosphatidate cytidylyltransferase [Microvirga guangxiensis]